MATPLEQQLLDYDALSEYTNISNVVLRRYLSMARSNRESGDFRKADLPEPDITIGRSPAWRQSTIDKWLASRPGKGVGGGPKPKAR